MEQPKVGPKGEGVGTSESKKRRAQRSVWKQVLTRRKAEEPLADFDDSLAVLKFGLNVWPNFFQSCQKRSRSAISHAQPKQAKAVARTGGKVKEIFVFAYENSILGYGDLMKFRICHPALPIVLGVRGISAHALEPIGKRGRELSIDQKPHAAAGDSTAWSAWSAA